MNHQLSLQVALPSSVVSDACMPMGSGSLSSVVRSNGRLSDNVTFDGLLHLLLCHLTQLPPKCDATNKVRKLPLYHSTFKLLCATRYLYWLQETHSKYRMYQVCKGLHLGSNFTFAAVIQCAFICHSLKGCIPCQIILCDAIVPCHPSIIYASDSWSRHNAQRLLAFRATQTIPCNGWTASEGTP